MGYYINPLMNAVFGLLFFREHLRTLQKAAIAIVVAGVAYMVAGYGEIPLYAITLSISFSVYGAVHKILKVDIYEGMFFEMLVLALPALICLYITGTSFFVENWTVKTLILLTGPVTILPLVGFAYGVQRLNLTTVGIIQYINPTATFILGILYFKEPFNLRLLTVFVFIWIGVFIYLFDAIIRARMLKLRR
jgi:chloramphenicol-sensitive protein RarD